MVMLSEAISLSRSLHVTSSKHGLHNSLHPCMVLAFHSIHSWLLHLVTSMHVPGIFQHACVAPHPRSLTQYDGVQEKGSLACLVTFYTTLGNRARGSLVCSALCVSVRPPQTRPTQINHQEQALSCKEHRTKNKEPPSELAFTLGRVISSHDKQAGPADLHPRAWKLDSGPVSIQI